MCVGPVGDDREWGEGPPNYCNGREGPQPMTSDALHFGWWICGLTFIDLILSLISDLCWLGGPPFVHCKLISILCLHISGLESTSGLLPLLKPINELTVFFY